MTENQYVLVCSPDIVSLYRLSCLGREIANQTGCSLKVMLFMDLQRRCEENAAALEYAFQCAKRLGAEMSAIYTCEPVKELQKENSQCLVVRGETPLAGQIRQELPDRRLVVMR